MTLLLICQLQEVEADEVLEKICIFIDDDEDDEQVDIFIVKHILQIKNVRSMMFQSELDEFEKIHLLQLMFDIDEIVALVVQLLVEVDNDDMKIDVIDEAEVEVEEIGYDAEQPDNDIMVDEFFDNTDDDEAELLKQVVIEQALVDENDEIDA